jgi:hypothetical protein
MDNDMAVYTLQQAVSGIKLKNNPDRLSFGTTLLYFLLVSTFEAILYSLHDMHKDIIIGMSAIFNPLKVLSSEIDPAEIRLIR